MTTTDAFGGRQIPINETYGEGGNAACPIGIAQCGCVRDILGNFLDVPEEGSTLAPWVCVTMENSGSLITVGNNSSPNTQPEANTAIVKSMDLGFSNGLSAKIVIHDQGGSEFINFMDNLAKDLLCLDGTLPSTPLILQFGWTKSRCGENAPYASSIRYYLMVNSIESNFSQGKFQYEITATDIMTRADEAVDEKARGGDGEEVALEDAIRDMLTDRNVRPSVASVRFLKKIDKNTAVPVGFKEGETSKGIESTWEGHGLSKLQVLNQWLAEHLTENDKPWEVAYNPEVEGGEVICWEVNAPNCVNEEDPFRTASYIVNGGKFSPVIEFNPSIKWNFGFLNSTSGAPGFKKAAELDQAKSSGIADCPTLTRSSNPSVGQSTTKPADRAHQDTSETPQADAEAAQAKTSQVSKHIIGTSSIEADLVIIGNPTFHPFFSKFGNVALVFVNPYNIQNSETGCEWLAKPLCNSILSNDSWKIMSVRHQIENGSYRTTLGLVLYVPGADLDKNNKLGGSARGWEPVRQC